MPTCKDDCLYYEACRMNIHHKTNYERFEEKYKKKIDSSNCSLFKDRSKFVELKSAQWVKHKPEIEKMREFHKLGIGKAMGENSIFWTCSICGGWGNLSQKYCSNCGAKMSNE